MGEPRIVLWDLETLPNLKEVMKVLPGLSAYPGLTLKASINSVICMGWKVFGEKEVHCINAWDFKSRWAKDVNDDFEVVKQAAKIIQDADAVVTHNGKSFDWKVLQTRLLFHGLKPLPKILHVDTRAESRKHLFMFNNRLNTLAKFFAQDEKLDTGWDLWVKVANRDRKSMNKMTAYCKQDVMVLENIFKVMRPLLSELPNYNLFNLGERPVCIRCGSTRLNSRGRQLTKTMTQQRFQCQNCGSWMNSKLRAA